MAVDELTISRWGDANPVTINVSRCSASRVISDVGKLSATVPAAEMDRLKATTLLDRWVRWEPGNAPAWGGQVMDERESLDGSFEIACDDFGSFLNARMVPRTYDDIHVPPGGHLARLLRSMREADGPVPFTSTSIDEDGEPMNLVDPARLEQLSDVLPDLLGQGHEWTVNADRVLTFRKRIGQDKTATAILTYPRHIIDGSISRSKRDVVNDLTTTGGPPGQWNRIAIRESDGKSIATYGLRQDALTFDRFSSQNARRILRRRLRRALKVSATPTDVPHFTLTDVDGCLTLFDLGDTIRAIMPRHDIVFRVLAIDFDGQKATITGVDDDAA